MVTCLSWRDSFKYKDGFKSHWSLHEVKYGKRERKWQADTNLFGRSRHLVFFFSLRDPHPLLLYRHPASLRMLPYKKKVDYLKYIISNAKKRCKNKSILILIPYWSWPNRWIWEKLTRKKVFLSHRDRSHMFVYNVTDYVGTSNIHSILNWSF